MRGYPWWYWSDRTRQIGHVSCTSAASGQVVTTAELKTHLRIIHSDEDDYLDSLIKAATQEIDMPSDTTNSRPGWLGRSLLQRTLKLTLHAVPPHTIHLPGPPVQSISTVEYRKSDDTFETIDSSDYHSDLSAEPAKLWPDGEWPLNLGGDWPQAIHGGPDTFRVTYVAGYASASDIPEVIKQWVLCRAAELYRDREGSALGVTSTRLTHIDRMLDNWRVR